MTSFTPPIAVTGLGVVSPIGIGRAAFTEALRAGKTGIRLCDDPALVGPEPVMAAVVEPFEVADYVRSPHRRRMDRFSRMVVTAARLALDDAGIGDDIPNRDRIGIVVGTSYGNLAETGTYLGKVAERGPAAASPLVFPNLVLNAPAGYVAMELGITGPNLTVCQAEVTGETAILTACDMLATGRVNAVLAGAGEELSPIVVHVERRAGLLVPEGKRVAPYDIDRAGLAPGEGAAFLLLERAEAAERGGRKLLAMIEAGLSLSVPSPPYAWSSSAPTAVEILPRAGWKDVDLVIGGANGTKVADATELTLFADAFRDAPTTAPWLTSIRGAIGEFASAGALSAAAAAVSLRGGFVTPAVGLSTPIPGSPFRFARNGAEEQPLGRALAGTVARGGSCAFLTLAAC